MNYIALSKVQKSFNVDNYDLFKVIINAEISVKVFCPNFWSKIWLGEGFVEHAYSSSLGKYITLSNSALNMFKNNPIFTIGNHDFQNINRSELSVNCFQESTIWALKPDNKDFFDDPDFFTKSLEEAPDHIIPATIIYFSDLEISEADIKRFKEELTKYRNLLCINNDITTPINPASKSNDRGLHFLDKREAIYKAILSYVSDCFKTGQTDSLLNNNGTLNANHIAESIATNFSNYFPKKYLSKGEPIYGISKDQIAKCTRDAMSFSPITSSSYTK